MRLNSRNNEVFSLEREGRPIVQKNFDSYSDWQRERGLYECLSGKIQIPRLIGKGSQSLTTELLPYGSLLSELERQEKEGFYKKPWEELIRWLYKCHEISGHAPGDGNLLNFLWDENAGIIGLDFEHYCRKDPEYAFARIGAYVLEYEPRGTTLKREIVRFITERCPGSSGLIEGEQEAIRSRRRIRKNGLNMAEISGIILAGGASSRMGRDKSALELYGKSLLEIQVNKLKGLGIRDIIISGSHEALEGTVAVSDEFERRGPLGGIHACLKESKNPMSLVLSVDVPLMPAKGLETLINCHAISGGDVTLLEHGEVIEPLIGVYNRELFVTIEAMIREFGVPVRRAIDRVNWRTWSFKGDRRALYNCNTPEDYAGLMEIASRTSGLEN